MYFWGVWGYCDLLLIVYHVKHKGGVTVRTGLLGNDLSQLLPGTANFCHDTDLHRET